MQATYDSQGKIVVEEGDKDATNMNGDVLNEVMYTHGNAPAPDQPGSWNVSIAQRVDLALLEQVSKQELCYFRILYLLYIFLIRILYVFVSSFCPMLV